MATIKTIEGRRVEVKVGSMIELGPTRYERLLPCDDWDGAEFRFPSRIDGVNPVACNVEITGRTFQSRYQGDYYVKVRVEWVGDGEPSTYCDGWLMVSPSECLLASEAA